MKSFFLVVFATFALGTSSFALEPVENVVPNSNDAVEILVESPDKIEKECYIKITGTYDGKEVDIEMEFTADNCLEAYKEILGSL